ncbi:hypothetical protein M378DRAFT_999941 [Amanita muscaria Koide BX008]|uniref:DUF6534 domain-containing protein n=1 Tax=Amanita muscaria (strain Koide BX008) TaxID=946122 RepID=A0A0C2SA35_AMAMK|nr:hypothetical protein M378DRAFT_999941 [Amanita muscaria Koide BX008]
MSFNPIQSSAFPGIYPEALKTRTAFLAFQPSTLPMPLGPEKAYGSLVLGSLFASFLSGLMTLQALLYFRLFSQDPKPLKSIVVIVLVLDLLHTAFMWEGMWFYVVKNFGDESKIELINYCIPGAGMTTAIITIITHCFYVQRIFRLSNRRYWIAVPILVVAFARMCGAFVASAVMLRITTFPPVLLHFSWVVTIPLSLSCAADILITLSMFVLLRTSRNKSLTLNHVVDLLVLYTFEMGTLTGCAAVVAMLCWVVVPNKLVFLGLYFPIGKFYANSLLGS